MRSWFGGAALTLMLLAGCTQPASNPPAKPAGPAPLPPNALEVVFTYGSEKESWIKDVTAAFNQAGHKVGDKTVIVTAVPMGSGDCIDELLTESRKAHLTSPASGLFIQQGNAQSRLKTGKDLLERTDNLVLSPVVIALWQPMAEALGWGKQPVGWADVLALAKHPQGWAAHGHPEWGKFKFGHTHPEYSNSGLISVLAEIYAATGKKAGLTAADLARPETGQFLGDIEKAVVHYGTSTGFFGKKLLANGPGYLSAAVLYENMVIEATAQRDHLPFPVVAVYPKEGTFWSDHPVGVVNRPWVTPAHKEAAEQYVKFLLDRPQQEKALTYGFRPGNPDVPLATPIDAAHGVNPKEPQTTLEVPAPEVTHAALQLWKQYKKRANVLVVFDVSGSMSTQERLPNAKKGAHQLLEMLGDDDRFALMPFNDKVPPPPPPQPLRTARAAFAQQIDALYAHGGTALYDAILAGYQAQAKQPQDEVITAVVVLTDGDDTNSRLRLESLVDQIKLDPEKRPIRVFTIGYGAEANKDVMRRIADATQAASYEGKPENIRAVFKDISTFF